MTSFGDLARSVAGEHRRVLEQTRRSFTVEQSYDANGRTVWQTVHCALGVVGDERWVIFEAPVGSETSLHPRDALVRNAQMAVGSLCLRDGTYLVRHASPLASLDATTFERGLDAVGHDAALLRICVAPRVVATLFAGYGT